MMRAYEPKDCVVVALPAHPLHPNEHCTIAAFGVSGYSVPAANLVHLVRTASRIVSPFFAEVIRTNEMGPDRVQVAEVECSQLRSLRSMFEGYANSRWGFRPHVTAQSPASLRRPGWPIGFNRLALWNGDERYTFMLGSGAPLSG